MPTAYREAYRGQCNQGHLPSFDIISAHLLNLQRLEGSGEDRYIFIQHILKFCTQLRFIMKNLLRENKRSVCRAQLELIEQISYKAGEPLLRIFSAIP